MTGSRGTHDGGRALIEVTTTASVDQIVASVSEAAGMSVFARVDHAAGARSAGLQLADEVVLLLGSPRVGTLVMQADARAGLDLPLRVLVWDEQGSTRIAWRAPEDLARLYDLDGAGDVLAKMGAALRQVVDAAA